jgi:hypothetical protein
VKRDQQEIPHERHNPQPPFPQQQQPMPGSSAAMNPQPDYGERTYHGSGRLAGKHAVITGVAAASAARSR